MKKLKNKYQNVKETWVSFFGWGVGVVPEGKAQDVLNTQDRPLFRLLRKAEAIPTFHALLTAINSLYLLHGFK